jgi:chemotaxis protein methyltransferase CheR
MEMSQYTQVKTQVWRLLRIDLNNYKSEQMCRRLDSWLVRSNISNWELYFHRLHNEPQELEKFRNFLTINVSEFFRDAERWNTVKESLLPGLLKEARLTHPGQGGLRVWSAGCSTGQEAYTLAILLDELYPEGKNQILATDLDRGALKKAAERGPYSAEDVAKVSVERMRRYFEPGGPPYYVSGKIASRITFREHDMLLDPFDTNYDLVVCRNVIIYFINEAKTELYKRFLTALRPGGTLFLGGTEVIPHPSEIGFRSQGISLYTRA